MEDGTDAHVVTDESDSSSTPCDFSDMPSTEQFCPATYGCVDPCEPIMEAVGDPADIDGTSYTTYELSCRLQGQAATLHSIFGLDEEDHCSGSCIESPMQFPPAFNHGTNGVDIGGGGNARDSWLTIGYNLGGVVQDSVEQSDIATIGIEFESWSNTKGLVVQNGAVWRMDAQAEDASNTGTVLVAQLTLPTEVVPWAILNARGRSTVGRTLNPDTGIVEGDWEQMGITFGNPPEPADCAGAWSECSSECEEKTYTVSSPAVWPGVQCAALHGDVARCIPGDDACAACGDVGPYRCSETPAIECSLLPGGPEDGSDYPRSVGFNCADCPAGSTGDGLACTITAPGDCSGCVDVDDCAGDNPCGENGACIDSGSNHYDCVCNDGYVFEGRESSETSATPRLTGTCVEQNNCASGENDCWTGSDDTAATCNHDGPGEHSCICPDGYSPFGDLPGRAPNGCTDTDACSTDSGEDRCFDTVECIDEPAPAGPNDYRCGDCPAGFSGSGQYGDCADIDDCAGNPCGGNGACEDGGVSLYTCMCDENYVFVNRTHAEDSNHGLTGTCGELFACDSDETNECWSATCDQATCDHTGPGQYQCICPTGYEPIGDIGGRGSDGCRDIDGCATEPCFSAGSSSSECSDEPAPAMGADGFSCAGCPSGYAPNTEDQDGITCFDIDDCIGTPCQDNAFWTDDLSGEGCAQFLTEGADACETYAGHDGGVTLDGRQACPQSCGTCTAGDVINPCGSAGECSDDGAGSGTYSCSCDEGYTNANGTIFYQGEVDMRTGKPTCAEIRLCQDADLNDCNPDLATCNYNGPGEHTCTCNTGYEGEGRGSAGTTDGCSDANGCTSAPCWSATLYGNEYSSDCTDVDATVFAENPTHSVFQCGACPNGFAGDGIGDSGCHNSDDCAAGDETMCGRGSCSDLILGYECACEDGWANDPDTECPEGLDPCARCSIDLDECGSNPCVNGDCTDGDNSYECACTAGFQGENCDESVDECAEEPCANGGVCTDMDPIPDAFSCNCTATGGWAGSLCTDDVDECEAAPCLNGGSCAAPEDSPGVYTCACVTGFEGDDCELNIDDCAETPCLNAGECVDGVDTFQCFCEDGIYEGDTCEIEIDQCADSNPCDMMNGVCRANEDGSPACECIAGFEMATEDDFTCTNINECASVPCQNEGASCIDQRLNYVCECGGGFSGANCAEDINECGSRPCANEGNCTEGVDAFTCACVAGWTGDTCATDINECASAPCRNGAECIDAMDGFLCNCADGWQGERCQEQENECVSQPCGVNGECEDLTAAYRCACNDGFAGQNCNVDVDECGSMPCANGGECVDGANGYGCDCAQGWAGDNCADDFDECASEDTNPCRHEATCVNIPASYACDCASGWSGENCEINIDECGSSPCVRGQCTDHVSSFSCECGDSGWQGELCDADIDDCSGDMNGTTACTNGGACTDGGANAFYCTCVEGFTSSAEEEMINCDRELVACPEDQTICDRDYAVCEDLGLGRAGCRCNPGYETVNAGLVCTEVDECGTNPCERGECTDGFNSYTCTCPAGWSGENCGTNINECMTSDGSSPCMNSAVGCDDGLNSYRCTCSAGWSGANW